MIHSPHLRTCYCLSWNCACKLVVSAGLCKLVGVISFHICSLLADCLWLRITFWFHAYPGVELFSFSTDFVERVSGLGDLVKNFIPPFLCVGVWECMCMCACVCVEREGLSTLRFPLFPSTPLLCLISAAFITFSVWFSLQGTLDKRLCST